MSFTSFTVGVAGRAGAWVPGPPASVQDPDNKARVWEVGTELVTTGNSHLYELRAGVDPEKDASKEGIRAGQRVFVCRIVGHWYSAKRTTKALKLRERSLVFRPRDAVARFVAGQRPALLLVGAACSPTFAPSSAREEQQCQSLEDQGALSLHGADTAGNTKFEEVKKKEV